MSTSYTSIIRDPLTQLRQGIADAFYEKKLDERYIQAIAEKLATIDKSKADIVQREYSKVAEALKSGASLADPDLTHPLTATLWGATLAALAVKTGAVNKLPIWKQIIDNTIVQQERQESAYELYRSFRKIGFENYKVTLNAPDGGYPALAYYCDPEKKVVNIDPLWMLLLGVEKARSGMMHEVAHALGTLGFPEPMQKLRDEIKQIKDKPEKTDEDRLAYTAKDIEWQHRYYIVDEAENSYANRFVINRGQSGAENYGDSLNHIESVFACINKSAADIQSIKDSGQQPDLKQRFMNLKRAIRYSLYKNNGFFPDTREGWRSVGVEPDWIEEYGDAPKSGWKALQSLAEQTRRMEELQPRAADMLQGEEVFRKKNESFWRQRMDVVDQLFEKFAQPIVNEMIAEALQKQEQRQEQKKQNQQQQNQQQDNKKTDQKDKDNCKQCSNPGSGDGDGQQCPMPKNDTDSDADNNAGSSGEPSTPQKEDSSKKTKEDKKKKSEKKQGSSSSTADTDEDKGSPPQDSPSEDSASEKGKSTSNNNEGDQKKTTPSEKSTDTPEDPSQPQSPSASDDKKTDKNDDKKENGPTQPQEAPSANNGSNDRSDDDATGEEMTLPPETPQEMKKPADQPPDGSPPEQSPSVSDLLDDKKDPPKPADGEKSAKEPFKNSGKAPPREPSAGNPESFTPPEIQPVDLNEYELLVKPNRPIISRLERSIRQIVEKQTTTKRVGSPDRSLTPKDGNPARLDTRKVERTLSGIASGKMPRLSDFKNFKVDERRQSITPPEIDIEIIIDVSGSMKGEPFDRAISAAVCLYESAKKVKGINVSITAMGMPIPTPIARPGQSADDISTNILQIRQRMGGAQDFLSPAVAEMLDRQAQGGVAGKKNGMTHAFIISDGFFNDKEKALTSIHVMATLPQQLTADFLVLKSDMDFSYIPVEHRMPELITTINDLQAAGKRNIGMRVNNSGTKVDDAMLHMVEERLRNIKNIEAVSQDAKQSVFQKALKDMQRRLTP